MESLPPDTFDTPSTSYPGHGPSAGADLDNITGNATSAAPFVKVDGTYPQQLQKVILHTDQGRPTQVRVGIIHRKLHWYA